jgi:EpsI family protein
VEEGPTTRPWRPPQVGVFSALLLALVLGGGIWVTRAVGYSAAPTAPATPDELPVFQRVPMVVDGWHGREEPIKQSVWDIMGVDAALSRVYDKDDVQVRLLVEVRLGGSRDQFHMPMVCMTANGWSTLRSGVEQIRPEGLPEPIDTVWIVFTQAGRQMLVRYWLWTGEKYVAAPSSAWRQLNAVAAWERLRNANPTGALFLCYTDLKGEQSFEAAQAAQKDLAEKLLPDLDQALQQGGTGVLD